MAETYNALEGELSIQAQETATRSGQTNAVVVVGGYDTDGAADSISPDESTYVTDHQTADELFGESELSRAIKAISDNSVDDIYAVPVPEEETTESFSSSQSLSLDEAPIFDPEVHPDHDVTVTDTESGDDLTTNVVYDDDVSTPDEEDTANVNPITGEIKVDESGDYDVSYTYGEYSDAIKAAVDETARYVHVGTEAEDVISTLVSELERVAEDFDFKRGIVGATPDIDTSDIVDYTPSSEDWRLIEVAPSRATGGSGTIRTAAAVTGFLASQPIGPDGSGLYEEVRGITDLETEYRSSEVKDFEGVTALTRNGVVGVAETTAETEQFRPIYAVEVIDEVGLDLFDVVRDYAGGPQEANDLASNLRVACQSNASGNPPLLGFGEDRDDPPYDVDVTLDDDDNSVANASVAIVPHPIAETVNLSMTVADGFVQFEGVQ